MFELLHVQKHLLNFYLLTNSDTYLHLYAFGRQNILLNLLDLK